MLVRLYIVYTVPSVQEGTKLHSGGFPNSCIAWIYETGCSVRYPLVA